LDTFRGEAVGVAGSIPLQQAGNVPLSVETCLTAIPL